MKELAVRGAGKSFGDHHVLDGVDLTVPAGSFTGILGRLGQRQDDAAAHRRRLRAPRPR